MPSIMSQRRRDCNGHSAYWTIDPERYPGPRDFQTWGTKSSSGRGSAIADITMLRRAESRERKAGIALSAPTLSLWHLTGCEYAFILGVCGESMKVNLVPSHVESAYI
jgi:hypothetical protein